MVPDASSLPLFLPHHPHTKGMQPSPANQATGLVNRILAQLRVQTSELVRAYPSDGGILAVWDVVNVGCVLVQPPQRE